IAPVTQQFGGLGSIYILPDQATVSAVYNANQPSSVSGYNASNAQNSTQTLGRISNLPSHEGDTGSVETFWPCVGATRIVPDYIKDWSGKEISRVYSDQWGNYNGLTYSTWEVNPPNPTGYAPTMMVTCMNDPGTGTAPDPLYNPTYSDFCYEIPFMPARRST